MLCFLLVACDCVLLLIVSSECVGVLVGVVCGFGCVCDCDSLLVPCCYGSNTIGGVVLECCCGDWCFVFIGCV